MGEDRFAFNFVQGLAYLGGRVGVVIEIADEGGDSSFEVDIVFPECVVRVDEESLAERKLRHESIVTNETVPFCRGGCGFLARPLLFWRLCV